jgi:hypothetical protein
LEAGWRAVQYPGTENSAWFSARATEGWTALHQRFMMGDGRGLWRQPSLWQRLGFDRTQERTRTWDEDMTRIIGAAQHDAVAVPWWLIVLSLAALPAVRMCRWLVTWRRRRCRKRHGLCLACGYDLRATAEHCPECGAAILARKAAQ